MAADVREKQPVMTLNLMLWMSVSNQTVCNFCWSVVEQHAVNNGGFNRSDKHFSKDQRKILPNEKS